MSLHDDDTARVLLARALLHAKDAAQRHSCAYLVWVREHYCQPLRGLDRRGQESGLYMLDLTIFVRPSSARAWPGGVENVRQNPKDAYVYARVTPDRAIEVLDQ